jgi:putative aminopeptidase FrvX
MKELIELLEINSPSGKEEKVAEYIKKHLSSIGVEFNTDTIGNVFNISHKNRPLLSAHMDTVKRNDTPIKIIEVKAKNGLTLLKNKELGVIGGDDKCGIYAILKILEKRKDINFVFTTQEEVGAFGASHFCSQNKLDHITYGIIIDRTGYQDIISTANWYGSEEFEKELLERGKGFGFKRARGIFSDCDVFSDIFSCANISAGYYNAHSPSEFICVEHLTNTINFVEHILNTMPDKRYEPAPLTTKKESKEDYTAFLKCAITGAKNDLVYIEDLEVFLSLDAIKAIMKTTLERVKADYKA